MNLADAIRQAASEPRPPTPQGTAEEQETQQAPAFEVLEGGQSESSSPKFEAPVPKPIPTPVVPKVAPVQSSPEPAQPEARDDGKPWATKDLTMLKMEIFLSPEQMNAVMRAAFAGQRTMLTTREAAHYLRVHAKALEEMASEGDIPAVQIDGQWRFPRAALDEWVATQIDNQEVQSDVA